MEWLNVKTLLEGGEIKKSLKNCAETRFISLKEKEGFGNAEF